MNPIKDAALSPNAEQRICFVSFATEGGWRVISEGKWGMQLERPRKFRSSLFLLGLCTLPLGGIGLLVWLWGVFDYLTRDDEMIHVTPAEIASGWRPPLFERNAWRIQKPSRRSFR